MDFCKKKTKRRKEKKKHCVICNLDMYKNLNLKNINLNAFKTKMKELEAHSLCCSF